MTDRVALSVGALLGGGLAGLGSRGKDGGQSLPVLLVVQCWDVKLMVKSSIL